MKIKVRYIESEYVAIWWLPDFRNKVRSIASWEAVE